MKKVRFLYCDKYPNKIVFYGDSDAINFLDHFIRFTSAQPEFNDAFKIYLDKYDGSHNKKRS